MKKTIIALIAVAVLAAVVLIFMPKRQNAPEFAIQTLNGQVLNNATLQNKVTLINFWFPSCPGCVSEMPKLIKMAHDYQDKDFQILGIAVPVDDLAAVQEYAQTRALPFAVAFDADKQVVKKFTQTELYPTSVLLDKQGRVLKTFVGEPDFGALYQEVNQELAK